MRAAATSQPVFLITHEFFPKRGGIATFTEEIAKASASLGYDVEVWAQSAPPAVEKALALPAAAIAAEGHARPDVPASHLAWQDVVRANAGGSATPPRSTCP